MNPTDDHAAALLDQLAAALAPRLAVTAAPDRLADAIADRVAERLLPRLDELAPPPDRLLGTREAAALLGVHERTVRDMIADGSLPSLIVSRGARRVRQSEIERYIAARS